MKENSEQKIRAVPVAPYPVHPYGYIALVASDATFAWRSENPLEAGIHLIRLIPPIVELNFGDP